MKRNMWLPSFTAVLLLAACSGGATDTGAAASNGAGVAVASSASGSGDTQAAANKSGDDDAITQINCAKIFKPDDVTSILGKSGKVGNYTLRDRSCKFETADGQTLTVYGGKGDDLTSQVSWNDATTSSDKVRFAKLDGVGDEAYWRKDGLHNEMLSRKGDLWCSISGGPPPKTEAEARKSGELCNKVYASGL
ncbi:MAG: hypothetical protein JSS21_05220 [Proteobacteria bacterium]|nr:hypothetical protein [Pseudomonadota bacterium]